MSSQQHYTIQLPCKPYIKKFAAHLFGDPVKADSKTTLGIIIVQSIEKNVYESRNIREWYYRMFMKERPALLDIHINQFQFTAIGNELPRASLLVVNRFLENSFDEFLYLYTSAHIDEEKRYNGKEQALIRFAEKYGLEVAVDADDDGDITLDALKKKENRFRSRQKITK